MNTSKTILGRHTNTCSTRAESSGRVLVPAPRTAAPWAHSSTRRRRVERVQWVVCAAAAKAEDAEDVDDLEDGADPEDIANQVPGDGSTDDSDFVLNFLWMDKNIAVAVDQKFSRDQRSPVTEYFFWPRKDAWEELKVALEAKPWIAARDKVLLLNRTTEVINFWQTDGDKPDIQEAMKAFPDCVFKGS